MSIAHFAVNRRVTVAMISTAIAILGIFAFPRLAVSLLPSFSPPVVTVTINYTNVAPETIETTVTRPVENAVSRVPGIEFLQTDSFQGQSVVRAQFRFGINIDTAAINIQEQVDRIKNQLPNDPNLQPPAIVKADPNALPVVFMFATDDRMPLRDLSDLIDNHLTDEFSAVPGVATVGTGGEAQRAIMIEPDINLVSGNQLTLQQLMTRVSAENVDLPAGIVQIGKNEYTIRTTELFKNAEEVANVVVGIKNGAPVYLRDVARVSDSIEEQRIFTREINAGKGARVGTPGVRMAVIAQPDANIVNVANGIYEKIAQIEKRYPGMHFGVVLDQRGFIQDSIAALEHTGLYGAALAILIILLFLHSYRSTIIVAVSLPVSILGTLFAAYAFGQTLNTMTMGGLALAVGLIVDDAIVVIENIFRHMEGGEPPLQASEKATSQILTAVVASSITVITVFVPLMLIPGLQGLIFGPFALMIMVAVGISLVVALTLVPMLSSRLLRPEPLASNGHPRGWYARFSAKFDKGFERFTDWYRGILEWAIDHPGPIVTIGLASLALALGMVKLGLVPTEVFPQTNSRFVRLDVKTPVGAAVAVTNEVCLAIEDAMSRDPLVVDIGSAVGTAGGGASARQITNQAQIFVTLKDGTSSEEASRFVQRWQGRLGGGPRNGNNQAATQLNNGKGPTPEQRARFAALQKALIGATVRARTIDIIQQQVSQGRDALQLQIFGPDVRTLFRTAQGVIDKLARIQGIPRPDTNITDLQPELDIQIDRRRAAQLGLSTGQIAAVINTATAGSIATYYELNGIQYPTFVQLPANQRRTFDALSQIQLPVPAAISTTAITGSGAAGATAASINGSTASVQIINQAAAPSSQSLVTVPLAGIAKIVVGNGPSQISRQNKERRIDINAPVIGRPLGDVVAEAGAIMAAYPLPAGYTWDFGPSIKQNNDTFSSLGLVVILAIGLIYMLLASQFESYLHPLVIMMAVPLSLVGVVGSLFISHRAFGLTAFIGTLMLVGIVVKNAILVVQFTNELRRQGMETREALMHAAPMRLRPILMTTLATVGGMVPLAFGFEAGSQTQAPLGTVVIGGLLTSTMLSLLVVPALYMWSAKHIEERFSPPKPPRPRRRGVEEHEVEPALG
ncbi:MAG TPA: efflux RND transporter permease subunit [Candidatus Binatia bacterium]|nr:efflux RND transporter permease subunit [Candidatus Binatia bacterium]